MLFDKRHKKKVQFIWVVLCILIIVSMMLLYTPLFR
jgi:predicted nucleic acid-binding Zn ribbon protein